MEQIERVSSIDQKNRWRLVFKWLLFPGLNVGTRKRMKFSRHLQPGDLLTLDAGCGNGAFSYAASRLGNKVVGINIDSDQVRRCEEYRDFIGIDPDRCKFKRHDIYEAAALRQVFDQIICFETLEHLERDGEVLGLFKEILNPGGLLHICTPRRKRAAYFGEALSETEDGGHVRLGYEFADLESLLAGYGFEVIKTDTAIGFFGLKVEEILNWFEIAGLRNLPDSLREILHTGLFLFLYPFTLLDNILSRSYLSIYVKARAIERQPV
ncbi:MAG: class I SAM-dependent methyltransferase [bacterium]